MQHLYKALISSSAAGVSGLQEAKVVSNGLTSVAHWPPTSTEAPRRPLETMDRTPMPRKPALELKNVDLHYKQVDTEEAKELVEQTLVQYNKLLERLKLEGVRHAQGSSSVPRITYRLCCI